MITHVKLGNWKNFKQVDVNLGKRVFIVGPNAAGKSNLLDAFRFLRDIAMPGGGLQKAIADRGGVSLIRCLAARRNPVVELKVDLRLGASEDDRWVYEIGIIQETHGNRKPVLKYERVFQANNKILDRPDSHDKGDGERLYQTALEQTTVNKDFRVIAKFLETIQYFHLVPQLLKYPQAFSGPDLPGDPFGRGFLDKLAKANVKTRSSWLRSIEGALRSAVPQLSSLEFIEENGGKYHIQALYKHWRPDAGKQHEEQFSDGTLRLIGLSWAMLQNAGPLLLEEPELSLNSAIVSKLPALLYRMQRKRDRQAFISTHSEALLSDSGISLDEIILLRPETEGTTVMQVSAIEEAVRLLKEGFTPSEIVQPKIVPTGIEQFDLDF